MSLIAALFVLAGLSASSVTALAAEQAPVAEVGYAPNERTDTNDMEFTVFRVKTVDGRMVTVVDEVGNLVFLGDATVGFNDLARPAKRPKLVGFVRVYAGGRAVLLPAYEE